MPANCLGILINKSFNTEKVWGGDRFYMFHKFVGDVGTAGTENSISTILATAHTASPPFLACLTPDLPTLLPVTLPPTPGPLCMLCLWIALLFLIYFISLFSGTPPQAKRLQTRSPFICSHYPRHLSKRVIIVFVILYLLVSFLINDCLLHWNISCLRGDNRPVYHFILCPQYSFLHLLLLNKYSVNMG